MGAGQRHDDLGREHQRQPGPPAPSLTSRAPLRPRQRASARGVGDSSDAVRAPSGRRSGSGRGSGSSSCFGAAGVADRRGRGGSELTWVSYVRSGAPAASRGTGRGRGPACAFGGSSPIRFDDPLDVAVDRHQRQAEAEQEQRPTRSSCRSRGSASASRGPRAAACRRGTRASSRRAPRGSCGASPGAAAPSGLARPPGRMTSISSGDRGALDRRPVRRRAVRQADAAPAGARARGCSRRQAATGRPRGGPRTPSRR